MSKKLINNIVEVRGRVIDKTTGKGIIGGIIYIEGITNNIILEYLTIKKGLFYLELENTQKYKVTFKKEGYLEVSYHIPSGMSSIYLPCLVNPKDIS